MRHIADKVPADGFQPPDLRQILEDHQASSIILLMNRRNGNPHKKSIPIHLDGGNLLFVPLVALLPDLNKLMVTDDLNEGAVESGVLSGSKQPRSSPVDHAHLPLVVCNDYAIGHLFQDGSETVAMGGQGDNLVLQLLGHPVEHDGESAHFICGGRQETRTEVALSHTFDDSGELADRASGALRNERSQ